MTLPEGLAAAQERAIQSPRASLVPGVVGFCAMQGRTAISAEIDAIASFRPENNFMNLNLSASS